MHPARSLDPRLSASTGEYDAYARGGGGRCVGSEIEVARRGRNGRMGTRGFRRCYGRRWDGGRREFRPSGRYSAVKPFLLADIGEGKLLFLQIPRIPQSSIPDDELSRARRTQSFKFDNSCCRAISAFHCKHCHAAFDSLDRDQTNPDNMDHRIHQVSENAKSYNGLSSQAHVSSSLINCAKSSRIKPLLMWVCRCEVLLGHEWLSTLRADARGWRRSVRDLMASSNACILRLATWR